MRPDAGHARAIGLLSRYCWAMRIPCFDAYITHGVMAWAVIGMRFASGGSRGQRDINRLEGPHMDLKSLFSGEALRRAVS